jgi:1-deoxy-D-xylulose-5-phosphate reductoisomerase
MPCALNAANEAAVELFLQGQIRFPQIAAINAAVMRRHQVIADPGLEQILAVDQWARAEARRLSTPGSSAAVKPTGLSGL